MIQHGNIVRDGADAVALYRIPTESYPVMPYAQKEDLLNDMAWLAHHAEADFSVFRVNRWWDVDRYAHEARRMRAPDAPAGSWDDYVASQLPHLRKLRPFFPEVYVAISLTGDTSTSVSGIELPAVARRALRATRRDASMMARLSEREEHTRELVRTLGGRPTTAAELQWLFARAETRGVREPLLDRYWAPATEAIERGRLRVRFEDPDVSEQPRTLVVGDGDAAVYQSMLCLGALPDEAAFPDGAEWMSLYLERLDFPVDATLHVRWESNPDALRRIDRKVRDADIAYHESIEGTDSPPSWQIEQNRQVARDAQDVLQGADQPPLLWASITLAVGAESRSELEERVRAVQRAYGNVRLYRPRRIQGLLYEDMLPGNTGRHVNRYEDPFSTTQVGALVPHATHEAGSRTGVYVAHTIGGPRRSVLVDLPSAPVDHGLPGWMIRGIYKSGKTMFGQYLAYQCARRGSMVVTVDPKGDHYITELPALAGRTRIIEPTGRASDQGLLDPLVVAPPAMREDMAISYYLDLLPAAGTAEETQIIKAVKYVLARRRPSGMRVIAWLLAQTNTEARIVGHALRVRASSGLGRLGFGHGQLLIDRTAQVTTIRPQGLVLPRSGIDSRNWSRDERLGVATMKLLVAFAMRLLGEDRRVHKVFVLDEMHAFRDNDGQRLVERVAHYGRTYNASAIFLAQLETMITDELAKLVGVRAAMEREGRGVLTDERGRSARIQVDVTDPEVLRILNTSPDARASSAPDAIAAMT